jgi:hypothetical protein
VVVELLELTLGQFSELEELLDDDEELEEDSQISMRPSLQSISKWVAETVIRNHHLLREECHQLHGCRAS